MKKLTLDDGVTIELSDEKYEALKKQFVPGGQRIGEKYYYIDSYGEIWGERDTNRYQDTYRYNTGNYFTTREQAEAKKEYDLAVGTVTRAITEANEGWEPNWENDNTEKCEIYYAHDGGNWAVMHYTTCQSNLVYPHCKTKGIANTIIENYTKELNIIRNYKR